MRVSSSMLYTYSIPVLVKTLQPVCVLLLFPVRIVQGGKFKGEYGLVIGQGDRIRHRNIFFQRRGILFIAGDGNFLIKYLEMGDHQGGIKWILPDTIGEKCVETVYSSEIHPARPAS